MVQTDSIPASRTMSWTNQVKQATPSITHLCAHMISTCLPVRHHGCSRAKDDVTYLADAGADGADTQVRPLTSSSHCYNTRRRRDTPCMIIIIFRSWWQMTDSGVNNSPNVTSGGVTSCALRPGACIVTQAIDGEYWYTQPLPMHLCLGPTLFGRQRHSRSSACQAPVGATRCYTQLPFGVGTSSSSSYTPQGTICQWVPSFESLTLSIIPFCFVNSSPSSFFFFTCELAPPVFPK